MMANDMLSRDGGNKYIHDIRNESCPIVKIKCKEIIYKPWLTGGLLNVIRKKNNVYKNKY